MQVSKDSKGLASRNANMCGGLGAAFRKSMLIGQCLSASMLTFRLPLRHTSATQEASSRRHLVSKTAPHPTCIIVELQHNRTSSRVPTALIEVAAIFAALTTT
jgi:hypothetical protein